MVVAEATTQDKGVPVTYGQLQKLMILEELGCVSSLDLLDTGSYSPDRTRARQQFLERFAFYDLLAVEELVKIQTLWTQFYDFCVPPPVLLDPRRYDSNLQVARYQLDERIMVFDCFRGVMGVFGKVRVGKSGFVAVHSYHGREWFDIPVVTYKFKYPPAFGDFKFINDDTFLDEVYKVSRLVEKGNGEWTLNWESEAARDETMSVFQGAQIDVEEAHKLFPAGSFTRLGRYWYEMIKEWGHYQCFISLITQDPDDLNRHVKKHLTHETWVSRNYTKEQTSDVKIRHMETGESKPVIHLYRPDYHDLWRHNAPIAVRSNVSRKEVDRRNALKEVE